MSVCVFLGDSVTDCQRKRAPRYQGTPEALGQGWVKHVVRKTEAATLGLDCWNRGFSGALTAELMRQPDWWPEVDGVPLTARIASLMIGINDVWHPFWKQSAHDIDAALAAYQRIIETLKVRAEQIVLVEPIALPCGEVQPQWWAPLQVLTEGQRALADAYDCVWVPLQDSLLTDARGRYEDYLHDGVHPTDLGHRWLSIRWLSAVSSVGFLQT